MLSRTLPLIFVCVSVLFWSIKPLLVTVASSDLDASELFVLASMSAVVTSAILCVSVPVVRRFVFSRDALRCVPDALVSGVFLSMWYYGFYRALMIGPKAEVTVVSFAWPMIALFALPLLSSSRLRMTWKMWTCIGLGCVGASLTVVSGIGGGGGDGGMLWSVIAALGSGLYLPFAVRAADKMPDHLPSVAQTFVSISLANVAALASVLTLRAVTLDHVSVGDALARASAPSLIVCLVIGLGVYLLAEVMWTWAMQSEMSGKIGSVPYLSPVLSVLLLALVFGESVSMLTIVGLVLVVGANVCLFVIGGESGAAADEVEDARDFA